MNKLGRPLKQTSCHGLLGGIILLVAFSPHPRQARSRLVSAVVLPGAARSPLLALAAHVAVILLPHCSRAARLARQAGPLDRLQRPVRGGPGHHLGMRELPPRPANRPNSL